MRFVTALGCVGVLSSLAAAQPAPDDPAGAPAPPPPPLVIVQPPSAQPMTLLPAPAPRLYPNTDRGTLDDANAGRVALMSTALTPPEGTWSFEDYELFLVAASYAPTDTLVLTATTMVPVTSEFYWAFLSAKLQVVRAGNLRVALQGGVFGIFGTDSYSNDSTGAFDLSAIATYCLDSDCYNHVSGSAIAGFARQGNSSVPVAFSAGIVAKISNHVRFVAEADTAHLFGDLSGQTNGILAWYGLRFTSKQIGVDLELVRPFCGGDDCKMDTFPLGVPFVAFSYRGLE